MTSPSPEAPPSCADGEVAEGAGQKVGVSESGEVQYRGSCDMLAFPWSFDKPGGPPR